MLSFLLAALPCLAIGAAVVMLAVHFKKKIRGGRDDEMKEIPDAADTDPKRAEDRAEDGFLPIGMSLGVCLGVAAGASLAGKFGSEALTYGICFGLLIGTVAGLLIKKKK